MLLLCCCCMFANRNKNSKNFSNNQTTVNIYILSHPNNPRIRQDRGSFWLLAKLSLMKLICIRGNWGRKFIFTNNFYNNHYNIYNHYNYKILIGCESKFISALFLYRMGLNPHGIVILCKPMHAGIYTAMQSVRVFVIIIFTFQHLRPFPISQGNSSSKMLFYLKRYNPRKTQPACCLLFKTSFA